MLHKTATPSSNVIKIAVIAVSVRRAPSTLGTRKIGTPLLTASIPVIAVLPLANARTSSHALTGIVASVTRAEGATGLGCQSAPIARTTPTAIVVRRQPTNK